MKIAFWLAWRELWTRRQQFAWSAAMVAAAVALLAGTELVSLARESAVATEIDYLGPNLRIVPAGISSTQLVRSELGDLFLPEELVSEMRDELSGKLRALEGRLLQTAVIDGVRSPIVGMEPRRNVGSMVDVAGLSENELLLGSDLARRLGKRAGQNVNLLGKSWAVARVLPTLGTAEDLALFIRLKTLQEALGVGPGVNEIRLYARPNASVAGIAKLLRSKHSGINVHGNAERGNEAERQTGATLSEHRRVVYALTALAVALGLLIVAYINAAERRTEMATLIAIGSTATTVLAILVARAAIVGLAGALFGYLFGFGIALLQDPSSTLTIVWSFSQPLLLVTSATGLSAAAAVPVSIHAMLQNHVRALQV